MTQLAGYHVKTTASRHEPGSVGSQPAYGLGTFAIIVIPALIPGITERQLTIGYVNAVAIIYLMVCVLGILRDMKYHGVFIMRTSSKAA
jgi:hypothetical protein